MIAIGRRRAMASLLGSAVGCLGWRAAVARGDAGALYLTCRADAGLHHHLTALDEAGRTRFDLALPDRGHGITLHPTRPEGVVFARRPGTFAVVFDHEAGTARQRFDATPGRHFYGHGVFSDDGRHLFTTENDYATGEGVVGIRDASDGYRHLGEMPSGGMGPHELALMPDRRTLVVANGGIRTHPDHDRDKLNLDTMQPSVAFVTAASGRVAGVFELAPDLHQNSIRHLDVDAKGRVAVALQFEGSADREVPLLGLADGAGIRMIELPADVQRRLQGYVGSIAYDRSGRFIAATGPKGGLTVFCDAEGGYLSTVEVRDGCGVAAGDLPGTFLLTSGVGALVEVSLATGSPEVKSRRQIPGSLYDNHATSL